MNNQESIKFGFKARSSNWTSLRLLNVYRLGLAAIFVSQSFLQESPLLYIHDLTLYAWTSFGYLLIAIIMTLASWIERRNFQRQVSVQAYFDIIAIILLMHACGGISSGLGMLLIISIAVTGLLGKNSMGTVFASLASVGLLAEHVYASKYTYYGGTSTQVGLLGAALFATALVTQILTQRIRSSEALIQKQKLDVANLSALNSEILQKMQSGVLALDSQDQVRHINDIAKTMLRVHMRRPEILDSVPFDARPNLPEIHQALREWRDSSALSSRLLAAGKSTYNIQISFHKLQTDSHQGTLIFLDDISKIRGQMQQAKLASLGHLTANIAHEIRNPLGAISHAAQLLAENQELPATEKRLSEIIQQHSGRINAIIEDIMQISRGGVPNEEPIQLNKWLPQFVESFCIGNMLEKDIFDVQILDEDLVLTFDSGHLNRILVNLCNNAKTHGNPDLPVYIKVYRPGDGGICISVADRGQGIKAEELDQIFEPFYTTGPKGSGLGLYIVSQLCDLNNASISVENNEHGGATFTITKYQSSQES